MARLLSAVDDAEAAVKELDDAKETLETLERSLPQLRRDMRKIERNFEEAQMQLNYWDGRRREIHMALSLSVGERALHFGFIERATVAQPVK